MIVCPTVEKSVIRFHYDWTSLFYRLLWGRHIHHGLWDEVAVDGAVSNFSQLSASSAAAQLRLTEAMIEMARIESGDRVLDVGCGLGGSSIQLARHAGCDVTGITLSRFQQRWASAAARWNRVASKTQFLRADAEQIDFEADQFDVVWSIECTEHLFDKPAFFRRAARWLKPGGRVAICAWLSSDESSPESRQQTFDVCEGFFCPSLGTADDYRGWMRDAGLQFDGWNDWTSQVTPTWEICQQRIDRTGIRRLARLLGADTALFVDRFNTILQAYRSGAMAYGCFAAHKPVETPAVIDDVELGPRLTTEPATNC